MAYLEDAIEIYYQKRIDYNMRYNVHPCTDSDIQYLEHELQQKLPQSYIAFLKWGGRQHIFGFTYETILQDQHRVRDMLVECKQPIELLPSNAVACMWDPERYSFAYFHTTDGDDPAIYLYTERATLNEYPIERVADGFWQYFYDIVCDRLRFIELENYEAVSNDYFLNTVAAMRVYIKSQVKNKVKPVTAIEIETLESALHERVPHAYQEFLLWGGKDIPFLWPALRWSYDSLISVQDYVINRLSFDLSGDVFVLALYSGSQDNDFHFIRLSEGDNPPVYWHRTRDGKSTIIVLSDTFTNYLLQEIEQIK